MNDRQPTMSEEECLLLGELISTRFGLHFPVRKREILESRLRPRLELYSLRSFFDYYLLLLGENSGELEHLARLVSNNETYFFRESYQFEALLFEQLAEVVGDSDRLRVLSAGCSSGEEPYTLGIISLRHALQLDGTAVEIDAFDIDQRRIEMARRGVYRSYSLRSLEAAQKRLYFRQLKDDRFELRPLYRQPVRFATGNIVQLETFRANEPYDAVFCRNVLIYFGAAALHQAIDNFAAVLRSGGLLFLGHSESIIGLGKPFETLRLDRCMAYRRL